MRKYHCTKKVEVKIPTDLRRIVGQRSQKLITRIGCIVRLYSPLNVEKWTHIPVDIIDKIVDIIYSEFSLPNENHIIDGLISSLHRIYNVWRARLHSDHYLKLNTDAQRRDHCPT
ncbi:hypothetical protein KSP39_PZI012825 [Platanthera zijinensis]|uniref:Uncharacterized protein n=1 Tax=Platanthera zijinensis TaxID=2320716 RepID=A0AAP0G4U7_9ASPA